jgi:hypothetical protein
MFIPANHGVNSEKAQARGKWSKPGWGHYFLESTEEQADHVKLTFVCLASTDPSNVETKHTEWLFFLPSSAEKATSTYEKVLLWALELGLVTKQQIDSNQAQEIQWVKAGGKQVVLHLEDQTYEGKTRVRVAYKGIFSDFNCPEVMESGCPFNLDNLRMIGVTLLPRKQAAAPTNSQKPAAAAKPATQPATAQTAATPATAVKTDLGDI